MMNKLVMVFLILSLISCKETPSTDGLTPDQVQVFNDLTNGGTNFPDGNTFADAVNNGPTSPTGECNNEAIKFPEDPHSAPEGYDDLINRNELSPKCNIVFVRHAERPSGVDRCLTGKGRSQARVLKSYLEGLTSEDGALAGDFDVLFRSKYKRVHHTLAFYQSFLNKKGTKMVTNPNGAEDGDHFRESSKRSTTRKNVKKAKEKILKECAKENADGSPRKILIGGHGTHGKALLKALMGKSLHEYPHHAEPYILALQPGSSSKFERVIPSRPLQSLRTTANPRVACDGNY